MRINLPSGVAASAMVRAAMLAATLVLCGCATVGRQAALEPDRPTAAMNPAALRILSNGAFSGDISSDETAAMCSAFRLSVADVSTYFAQARRVQAAEYAHELIASNCHASGTYSTAGGQTLNWKIDQARRGMLHAAGKVPTYYYCARCESPAFYAPCDIECLHAE